MLIYNPSLTIPYFFFLGYSLASFLYLYIISYITDYRYYIKTQDRHPEDSKTALTPPYILVAD
jgi:hypothetical protein